MEHRNPIYIGMLLAGTLNDHLTETDRNAEVMFSQMVTQFAAADQVNEALKASDQMECLYRICTESLTPFAPSAATMSGVALWQVSGSVCVCSRK